jgi:hypothetical protein
MDGITDIDIEIEVTSELVLSLKRREGRSFLLRANLRNMRTFFREARQRANTSWPWPMRARPRREADWNATALRGLTCIIALATDTNAGRERLPIV